MMIRAYFNRLVWQFLRGLVQLLLIIVLPSRLGTPLYTTLDYVMTISRSFSSFSDTILSVYYQDESLEQSKISIRLLNVSSAIIFLGLLFLYNEKELVIYSIPILFIAYIYTDTFVRILDINRKETLSSVIRFIFPLFFVSFLYFTSNVLMSSLVVLSIPISLYFFALRDLLTNDGLKKQSVKFWRNNKFIVFYGLISLIYSIADRNYIFHKAPDEFSDNFAKLSRVLVLVGFIMSSLTAFVYRDAQIFIAKLKKNVVSVFIFGVLSFVSLISVLFCFLLFQYLYHLELSVWEVLCLYTYIPLQISGVIVLMCSLRTRNRKNHVIEGIVAMLLGFAIEVLLFQFDFFIVGVLVKMIVTSLLWQWLIFRALSLALSGLWYFCAHVLFVSILLIFEFDYKVLVIYLLSIQSFWVIRMYKKGVLKYIYG